MSLRVGGPPVPWVAEGLPRVGCGARLCGLGWWSDDPCARDRTEIGHAMDAGGMLDSLGGDWCADVDVSAGALSAQGAEACLVGPTNGVGRAGSVFAGGWTVNLCAPRRAAQALRIRELPQDGGLAVGHEAAPQGATGAGARVPRGQQGVPRNMVEVDDHPCSFGGIVCVQEVCWMVI